MSRNSSGVYTLPSSVNPVTTLTKITSNWANTTLADIAGEITNSLDRGGRGGMTAPLLLADGTTGAPGMAFVNDPFSGWCRTAAQNFRFVISSGGTPGTRIWLQDTLMLVPIQFGPATMQLAPVGARYRIPLTISNTLLPLAEDASRLILFSGASASLNLSGAGSTLEIGSELMVYNPVGGSPGTIVPTGTGTLTWLPTLATGTRTLAAGGYCTILKVSATGWIINGTGLT